MRRVAAFFALYGLSVAPAWAQHLGQAPDDDISFMRVFLALLFCLIVAVGAAFVLKARSGGGLLDLSFLKKPAGRMRLVETLRLAPQASVCMVVVDGQEMLIQVSPQGVGLLMPPKDVRP